jgi:hypothetical protein
MSEILNLSKFKKLMHRPMTRREFLGVMGLMALSILGLASLLKNFSEINIERPFYGNGGYGGKKKGGV